VNRSVPAGAGRAARTVRASRRDASARQVGSLGPGRDAAAAARAPMRRAVHRRLRFVAGNQARGLDVTHQLSSGWHWRQASTSLHSNSCTDWSDQASTGRCGPCSAPQRRQARPSLGVGEVGGQLRTHDAVMDGEAFGTGEGLAPFVTATVRTAIQNGRWTQARAARAGLLRSGSGGVSCELGADP
jgi:hypothetical protein